MLRLILVLLMSTSPAICIAQTAIYRGRTYTPESFPRATWCRCGMCQQIRAQWAQKKAQPAIASTSITRGLNEPSTRAGYKLVNRPIEKTEYRKQCINGVCRLVPFTTKVDNWIWVPVPSKAAVSPKPAEKKQVIQPQVSDKSFEGTPASVVPVMISLLDLGRFDSFVDVGCGDGRLVIEAAKTGALATGIELIPSIAQQARTAIASAKVDARIITADFKSVKLGEFSAVALYQYPDTLAEIVRELSPGTRVVSYAHQIPGVECKEIKTTEASIYVGVIPQPDVEKPKPLTFGL